MPPSRLRHSRAATLTGVARAGAPVIAAAAALVASVACTPRAATPPASIAQFDTTAWRDTLAAWRDERIRLVGGPDGWAAVTALVWLDTKPRWTIGSAPGTDVPLAPGHAPAQVGTLEVNGMRVQFQPAHADSQPRPLATDARGAAPTVLTAGSVTLRVIERVGRLALRVKDSLAEPRQRFAGLDFFPDAPAWRRPARLERGSPADSVPIINVLGQVERWASPGLLAFSDDSTTHRLRVVIDPADTTKLFLLFRDQTSRDATYPAGRFVNVPHPDASGWTVADFNRAFTPPCAYTAFATCPLPPRENVLPMRVEAGERNYTGQHAAPRR